MNPDPIAPPTARDYLRILARRWWVVVLGIVGFAALGVLYSYRGPTIYKSSSEVRFTSGGTSSVAVNSSSHANSGTADRDVLTEVEVIKAPRFKNHIIDLLHLGPKAIKQVNVSNILNTNAIKITIGTAQKALSVQVADEYAKVYVSAVQAQQAALTKQQTASTLNLLNASKKQVTDLQTLIQTEARRIDALAATTPVGQARPTTSPTLTVLTSQLSSIIPAYTTLQQQYGDLLVANATSQPTVRQISDAVLPTKQSQPQPVKYGIVGLLLGIILGIAGAFGFELLTDKVRTRQDVERFSRLTVLAMVPRRRRGRGASGRPVALTDPGSASAEAYRGARAGVQFLSMRTPLRRILVTGLRAKDHQDIAAANLAVTLAGAGSRVVLVDADLRSGELHERFGLTRGNGLTTVLLGDTPLTEALRAVEVPGGALRVLTTGPVPPNPADLIASDSLATVLADLAKGADFVVVSSPPLLPFNDALSLARHADAVIMVTTARRTRRRQLADGAAKLARIGAPAIGVILDRGTRGADAYEATVGRVHIGGDALADDAPPAPAAS
ncbi:MAG: tyrosine-protein kinase [Actinomycetota bacterium]|nr:tyrosine-protein kinase [Actinomycetota bacterium]